MLKFYIINSVSFSRQSPLENTIYDFKIVQNFWDGDMLGHIWTLTK